MTYPYASNDPAVTNFITAQNSGGARGVAGAFMPSLLQNGIAGATTDNVIGFSTLTSSGTSAIALGSGVNTVIIDGNNSSSVAGTGAPDNFSFTVDPTGLVTLTDTTTGKTQQVSGVSNLIFEGAVTGGSASPGYQQMFFIGNTNTTQATELYNAALGRQPDLPGVEYYVNQLNSGYATQQIAAEFLASPEFTAKFTAASLAADNGGPNDQAYVTQLYQNVLHRTPSATELSWYVTEVQTTFANVFNYKAILLLDFAVSPENQADTSSFIINTGGTATSGHVYSTPASGSETGAQAVAAAQQTGNLDTTAINPATAATGHSLPYTPGSLAGIQSPLYTTVGPGDANVVVDYGNSGTITLSSAVPNFAGGATSAIIVNGSTSGGSYIQTEGAIVNLHGTGNYVSVTSPQPASATDYATVSGWTSGDALILPSTGDGQPYAFYSPSSSSPMQGGAVYGYHSTIPHSVIYVGSVGGGTPAEVAAAATKVYIPNDTAGEAAIFYGQTNSGGTAIYDWLNYATAPNGADTHNDHTVHADDFSGGVILVGVAPSAITASTFHS